VDTLGAAVDARCWLDADGRHVWTVHTCVGGLRSATMLPWPVWMARPDGTVDPAIDCHGCGAHYWGFLDVDD